MAKSSKEKTSGETSEKAASAAGKVLGKDDASKKTKTAAGSALSQRPAKKK